MSVAVGGGDVVMEDFVSEETWIESVVGHSGRCEGINALNTLQSESCGISQAI